MLLLHVLVLDGRGGIAAALGRARIGEGFVPVFLASFVLVAGLAAVSHRFVERPSSAALRRLLARPRGPSAARPCGGEAGARPGTGPEVAA